MNDTLYCGEKLVDLFFYAKHTIKAGIVSYIINNNQIMARDPRYEQLYVLRPGVTSYATLKNGYTDTIDKMLKRLEMDLYYLEHQSLWMDLKILWKTFVNIVSGKIF